MNDRVTVDALPPREMAQRAIDAGVIKSQMGFINTFSLAILAGGFIGLGSHFATLVSADKTLGYSMTQLMMGLVFCLGLILVVIAGAELFTGNTLIVMAWVAGRTGMRGLLRNWLIVYFGNFVGSLATIALIYGAGGWRGGSNLLGQRAVEIALYKTHIPWGELLFRGILCNALVCLAVWLCYSCRSTIDKIMAIIFPITAFVAMGFEHSVANMFLIPMGMLLARLQPQLLPPNAASLDGAALLHNLVPVTLGNIVGGALMVGFVYWFIYLRAIVPFSPTDPTHKPGDGKH